MYEMVQMYCMWKDKRKKVKYSKLPYLAFAYWYVPLGEIDEVSCISIVINQ